ncbi:MAG: hypothetical protein HY746_10505 [Elusimicrobia bacterium]|nr:hypothetical protein [Elusimicrobiota bacterium]
MHGFLVFFLFMASAAYALEFEVRHVCPLVNEEGNSARILGQDAAYSVAVSSGSVKFK